MRILVIVLVLSLVFVALVHWRAARHERLARAEFPPDGQLVDVDGRTVHAVVMGSGPDLVLIHGASGSTRDMTFAFAPMLADRYRVIVFDRPGLGYSDRVDDRFNAAFAPRGESPAEQAALLQAAAAKLGADRPLVLGHSYGGAVALAWALNHPDNIAGLVSVGGVALPWPGDLGPLYRYVGTPFGGAVLAPLLSAFVPDSYVENTIAEIFAPAPAPDGYGHHVAPALTLRRDTIRANARQVNHLRPFVVAMSAHYPTLSLPVELVHGDADTIVPIDIHARPVSRIIPGANLTEIPAAGHMPHHTHPEVVIAAIDRVAGRAGLR